MSKTNKSLKILSLNVQYGQLRNELLEYVKGKLSDVSVFCFQETDSKTRDLFDDLLLKDFSGYHETKYNPDDTHYLSTYVRRDITVLNTSVIYKNIENAGYALRSRLATPDDYYVNVSNVYGFPRPGSKLDTAERISFSEQLVRLAKNSGTTEVIMGDFNLLPNTESIKMFSNSGFRDLISEFKIPTTRNELAWQQYPSHMKQLYADYAFVKGADIDYDFTVEDITVSDHLPLVVDIYQPTLKYQPSRVAQVNI